MVKGSGKTSENQSDVLSNANDTIEVFFVASGTDVISTDSKWYFNLEDPAHGVSVKADKVSQIIQINGRTLKSPINIAANGGFSDNIDREFARHHYVQLKIKAANAATLVEIFGRC